MKKQDRLCRQAKEICLLRGHTMTRFAHGKYGSYAQCKLCFSIVIVRLYPMKQFGEAPIMGPAAHADCKQRGTP